MPGVTAQIDRYAVQSELRAFAPEFAEAENYSMPVDNVSVFEQLQHRTVLKRLIRAPQPGAAPIQME
ncbi:hypothetical protein D3C73_1521280 [compost metagenome]